MSKEYIAVAKMKIALFVICYVAITAAYEQIDVISGRIETCRGCSLNRLPEVKGFVMNDAPYYDRLEVKFISGAPPELVLLGEGDRELERIPLSQLSRQQCNELVESRGFAKKSEHHDL